MKKVKILVVVFSVSVLLAGLSGICYASYQEYDTGYIGIYRATNNTFIGGTLVPGLTSRDSIISVNLRYRVYSGDWDQPTSLTAYASYNSNAAMATYYWCR